MRFLRNLLWKWGGHRVRQKMLQDSLKAWRIVTVENEKIGTVVMRLRIEQPRLPSGVAYCSAVSIEWPYESESPGPPPNVKQQMDGFEGAIEDLTDDNELSELMLVRTGLGIREWLFYSCDQPRFMERFNALLAGHPAYPLRISFVNDPDWKLWREMVDEVRDRAAAGGTIHVPIRGERVKGRT